MPLESFFRSELFVGLSRVEAQDVAALAAPVEAGEGAVLFREGDPADGMYVVGDGTVRIEKGEPPATVATLGPGDGFGEMALLLEAPRTATAVAATAARLWRIDRDAFLALVESQDRVACTLLYNLARMLCVRLRDATAQGRRPPPAR